MEKNKSFLIIFDNDLEIMYRVHDSALATAWIHKIKHLQKIPIDPVESQTADVSNIKGLYTEFCQHAEIKFITTFFRLIFKANRIGLYATVALRQQTHEQT